MKEELVRRIDNCIYHYLTRPRMYFMQTEALVQVVLELLDIRAFVVDGVSKLDGKEIYRRLGVVKGPSIQFPERFDKEFVETLKVCALENGYTVGDKEKLDLEFGAHWDGCKNCRMRGLPDVDPCIEGIALSNARAPMGWQHPVK